MPSIRPRRDGKATNASQMLTAGAWRREFFGELARYADRSGWRVGGVSTSYLRVGKGGERLDWKSMLTPLSLGISAGLGGLGLAVGGCAYAAMWPSSSIFGEALIAPRNPGELALTFDDGPNPAWTPRLLDVLAECDVRATFFMVGKHALDQAALVRRIAKAGHLIGNHSWSHPNLAVTRASRVREELTRTSTALSDITGQAVGYFRPPFGGRRLAVLRIARELGMTPVLWNAMTNDWSEPSMEAIFHRLTGQIDRLQGKGRAANIVLHDGGHAEPAANREPSVSTVARLLTRYKDSHKFVTVDAWA
jgi:peptidoglycan/xylan/chitin deacetylase (PgdA/CDA1 family)